MNRSKSVIISTPKLTIANSLAPESAPAIEEKGTEAGEAPELKEEFKIISISLRSLDGSCKNSAFSFYAPLSSSDHQEKPENEGFSSGSRSKLQDEDGPRREKRKRDKREQNRLETKNLNRYFRSKINEMLRDVKERPSSELETEKAEKVLTMLNKSNKIMFSQLREIIKDEWLQQKLLCCTGILLKYIHGGKMGMKSKLIMLKYYNKILKAIRKPDDFTCWK